MKTLYGGIISLMLSLYLLVFFTMNLKKIHNVETSQINKSHGWLNLTMEGPVAYHDIKTSFIYTISNEKIGHEDF